MSGFSSAQIATTTQFGTFGESNHDVTTTLANRSLLPDRFNATSTPSFDESRVPEEFRSTSAPQLEGAVDVEFDEATA